MVNTEQHQVHCKNGSILYLLTRKPVKNINLRIRPDGRILLSANDNVPIEYINKFVEQKQDYIIAALAKYEERHRFTRDVPRKYVSGENYDLLGKNLRLKVEQSKREVIYTDGVFIFLEVRDTGDFQHKESMMKKWLEKYQETVFRELVYDKYLVFQKYGVPYPDIKVRYMTSRWGSCQPKKAIITLNSRLIEMPRNCIEYVVLHEFTHFIYSNHSRQFWDFVTMMMPDWKERKKELEKRL